MLKTRTKRIVRICKVFMVLNIAFLLLYFSSMAQALEPKEGSVIYASNKAGFIFINLGTGDVREGDLVEVYRDSARVGTFSIKSVMRNMSEAWVVTEGAEITVKVGDKALIPQAAGKEAAKPSEKPAQEAEQKGEPLAQEPSLYSESGEPAAEEAAPEYSQGEEEAPPSYNPAAESAASSDELNSLRAENNNLLSQLKGIRKEKEDAVSKLKEQLNYSSFLRGKIKPFLY